MCVVTIVLSVACPLSHVCTTCTVPPLFVIEFLHRIMDVFAEYFGECSETKIKDHYVTVYEVHVLQDVQKEKGWVWKYDRLVPNVKKVLPQIICGLAIYCLCVYNSQNVYRACLNKTVFGYLVLCMYV